MIPPKGVFINSNHPGGWETAPPYGVRLLSIVSSKGGKAISREPNAVTSSSKWLRLTTSEAVVEASLRLRSEQASRTCLRWFNGRPKRECIQATLSSETSNHSDRYRRKAATLRLRSGQAYGHKPINLRNGVTRCRLSACPECILSLTKLRPELVEGGLSKGLDRVGNQPHAPAGRMPREAKAQGNAWDMLTRGGYSGRQGHVLEAEVYDTRLPRSESQLPQKFSC